MNRKKDMAGNVFPNDNDDDAYVGTPETLNELDLTDGDPVGEISVDHHGGDVLPDGYENRKIFPCRERTVDESHKAKTPLTRHGVKDATNDPQQIAAWKREFPDCMWGVATGKENGFFVVDLDRGHAEGEDGVQSLAKYCDEHGYEFPLTLRATTGGGGMHLYFRMPSDGMDIRNSAGKILPGVDVRGTSGYVIMPPSVNQDTGKAYKWEDPLQPMAEAPSWLLELILKKKEARPERTATPGAMADGWTAYGRRAFEAELAKLRKASEGERNSTLNEVTIKLAGLVKGGELDGNEVYAAIEAVARETGLSDSEIQKTMSSAWKAATPRTAPPRADGADVSATFKPDVGPELDGPLPLRRPPQPQRPYPVGAFFEFCQAVVDVATYTQTSPSLVGSTMLAALSLMSQPLANVKTAKYRTPLSLFMLTVGETGDGKSTVESILFKPIREKEKELQREYEDKRAEYEAAQKTYDREVKRLDGQKGLSREEYQEQLTALEATKPMAPVEPFLFTGDANIEGLYRNLRYGLPYIGLFVGDGGRFLGGTAFTKENVVKTISNLSELWSGNALDKMRYGEGASKLYDRRICSSIMIQPVLAQRMLTDAVLDGQGFLCRHLFSWPASLPKSPDQAEIELLTSVQAFYRACEVLLNLPFRQAKDGGLLFDDLTLSPEALEVYQKYFRYVEENRRPNEKYEPVNGYAKRAAEQALRIAGCLSMARNPAARVIEKETMEAGIALADWYLDEILRITLDDMASSEILQAEKLLQWFRERGIKATSVRQVLRLGPNALRERESILKLFAILEEHGWLIRLPEGAFVWNGEKKNLLFAKTAWKVADDIPN